MQFTKTLLAAVVGLVALSSSGVAATPSPAVCKPCGANGCAGLTTRQAWDSTRASETTNKVNEVTYTYKDTDKGSLKVVRAHKKGSKKSTLTVDKTKGEKKYLLEVETKAKGTLKYLVTKDCQVTLKQRTITSVTLFTD